MKLWWISKSDLHLFVQYREIFAKKSRMYVSISFVTIVMIEYSFKLNNSRSKSNIEEKYLLRMYAIISFVTIVITEYSYKLDILSSISNTEEIDTLRTSNNSYYRLSLLKGKNRGKPQGPSRMLSLCMI